MCPLLQGSLVQKDHSDMLNWGSVFLIISNQSKKNLKIGEYLLSLLKYQKEGWNVFFIFYLIVTTMEEGWYNLTPKLRKLIWSKHVLFSGFWSFLCCFISLSFCFYFVWGLLIVGLILNFGYLFFFYLNFSRFTMMFYSQIHPLSTS